MECSLDLLLRHMSHATMMVAQLPATNEAANNKEGSKANKVVSVEFGKSSCMFWDWLIDIDRAGHKNAHSLIFT